MSIISCRSHFLPSASPSENARHRLSAHAHAHFVVLVKSELRMQKKVAMPPWPGAAAAAVALVTVSSHDVSDADCCALCLLIYVARRHAIRSRGAGVDYFSSATDDRNARLLFVASRYSIHNAVYVMGIMPVRRVRVFFCQNCFTDHQSNQQRHHSVFLPSNIMLNFRLAHANGDSRWSSSIKIRSYVNISETVKEIVSVEYW